jgi:hypothetical protein
MSWKDIINVGSAIKDIVVDDEKKEEKDEDFPDEVFELFRSELEKVGKTRLTFAEARKLMNSYEELDNPSEDTRKKYALLWV